MSMPIILSPKIMERFQEILIQSLTKNGFSAQDAKDVSKGAMMAYHAVARQNALKPKTLPDTGLDVATALKQTGLSRQAACNALVKDPALLFKAHGIPVPADYKEQADIQKPDKAPKKPRLPRSPSKRSAALKKIPSLAEIIRAAEEEYDRTSYRPDLSMGIIKDGPLAGARWSTIAQAVSRNTDFQMKEGFISLTQIFNVAMLGSRKKPCDPVVAQKAYKDAFERAASSVPKNLYDRKNILPEGGSKIILPHVFQMLEESLIQTHMANGRALTENDLITHGPLGGMLFTYNALHDMFHKAKNDYPSFPFYGLNDFMAGQEIWKKVAIRKQPSSSEPEQP